MLDHACRTKQRLKEAYECSFYFNHQHAAAQNATQQVQARMHSRSSRLCCDWVPTWCADQPTQKVDVPVQQAPYV